MVEAEGYDDLSITSIVIIMLVLTLIVYLNVWIMLTSLSLNHSTQFA